MLLIVFIAFAALLVAWLVAPNGEAKSAPRAVAAPVPTPAPTFTASNAGA